MSWNVELIQNNSCIRVQIRSEENSSIYEYVGHTRYEWRLRHLIRKATKIANRITIERQNARTLIEKYSKEAK